MPISGSDLAITSARSGVARSGATRSGWPILQGFRVPLYALSGRARSGGTRSGYTSPQTFLAIAGVQYGVGHSTVIEIGPVPPSVLIRSLSIDDSLNDAANTAQLTVMGFTPTVGHEIVITLGSQNNLSRLYAGVILNAVQSYTAKPANILHTLSCIDHTWGLNTRKVTGHYTGTLTVIARALLAEYAPGYTAYVADNLPLIEGGITFTDQDLTSCLTQVTRRGGADWKCDYFRRVRVFVGTDTSETAPTVLNTVNPHLLNDPALTVRRDVAEFVSRVIVEGMGANSLELVEPGETILPVVQADWAIEAGGTVVAGPQRITYTGRRLGGGGSLVGPGAAPTAAPNAALASGSGIESGAHDYAIVFETASGLSLPGPRVSVTVGALAAPSAAPTAGTPTVGTGPNAGEHQYAVTFVTAAGETLASPVVTKATGVTPPPTTAPTPTAVLGAGIEEGSHDYAVSFVSSVGETTPGPIGNAVTLGLPAAGPISAPGALTVSLDSPGILRGAYSYGVTFVNAYGETELGALATRTASGLMPPTTAMTFDITPDHGTEIDPPTAGPNIDRTPTSGSGGVISTLGFVYTFVNALGETTASPISTIDIYANTTALALANIQTGDGNTTKRRVYRRESTAGDPNAFYFVAEIADNTTTTLANADRPETTPFVPTTNTTANGPVYATYDYVVTFVKDSNPALQTEAGPPVSIVIHTNTTRLDLEDIPLGTTGTTHRMIYRRTSNATDPTAYLWERTIADNTTTTVTSVTLGNFLTDPAPTSNTTGGDTHILGNIPTGPAGVTARKLYRTASAGSQHKFLATINNNSVSSYSDNLADTTLGSDAPTSNTTAAGTTNNRIALTGIQTGASSVTSRKLFRRSAGLGLKLVTTIANNSTTTYTDSTPNASLGAAPLGTSTAYLQRIPLTALPLGGPLVTSRRLWGTAAGSAQLKLITTLNTTDTTYTVTTPDGSLGANIHVTNTAAANQVQLSGIPIGASAVTARNGYRTAVGSAQLKLAFTIANNTATSYLDALPDGSLGADVPISDASGLTQPDGNVPAGSITLPTAGTADFEEDGGWAVIGNGQQIIRYHSLVEGVLTGIPPSGSGAITATVGFNSTVTAAPCLTGIPASGPGAIVLPIARGDSVNLRAQVDDLDAQTFLAALLTTADFTHDGIIEDILQDRRLSFAEATSRGAAHLAARNQIVVSLTYATRDRNTRAGQVVSVNLGAPTNVVADFTIQHVAIGDFHPTLDPVCTVQASSDRFTFTDLLRMAGKAV